MRVQMLSHFTGHRNGEEWPPVGGTIDVPDHEAADLIANGYAKEAPGEDPTDASITAEDGSDEAPAEDGDAAGDPEPDEPAAEPVRTPAKKAAAKKAAPKAQD